VTTANGTRVVPESRAEVWQALAVLEPYCAVCDVTYVVPAASRVGKGTQFVCAPGRLDGAEPPAGAPRGEILEWAPRKVVATRLVLTTETWTTRIELADADGGGTRVTMTVALETDGGSRIVRRIQRSAAQRMVQETVDAELDKVPEHLDQAAAAR
jgi:phage baseplate assembly protein W